jgi:hypothetical protein
VRFRCNKSTTDQIFFSFVGYWEKNGSTMIQVHQLLIDFKKAYDSVRREVLYNILIQSGVPMELVGLIKMCLNETDCKVRIGKHSSDTFIFQNGLKQGDALSPLARSRKSRWD